MLVKHLNFRLIIDTESYIVLSLCTGVYHGKFSNQTLAYFSVLLITITKYHFFILFKQTHALCTVSSQPNIPQTSTSGMHTHRQHTATYQINNLTTQTSKEVVTALSTKDGLLKMVKQL
jgi:hypothetical protein